MKDDKYFLGRLEDRIARCENRYIVTYTEFMDTHSQSQARIYCRKNGIPVFEEEVSPENFPPVRSIFYGGYEDSERVILINLPDYAYLENEIPLKVIRAKADGGKNLTHRDYLGSLLGLGIKREMVGDILVREDGADIIVLDDIADFILMNYTRAGRIPVSVSLHQLDDLIVPPRNSVFSTDTVASLRLDSVISSAFGFARSKAADGIKAGLVSVNHMEVTKPDYMVDEGDILVLRGKGKARLTEVGGRSRKDRTYITIEKY